jgi:hypothetical protein
MRTGVGMDTRMGLEDIGRKDVFMSTTICEDRLSSLAMNCSG